MIESVSLEPTCCSTLSSFYLFTCIIKTSNGPHTVYTLCFCTIILAHVATCNNCTYLCMVMHPFPPLLPQTRKLVGLHALVMILLLPRKQQFLRLLPQVTCTVGCVAWFACTCMIQLHKQLWMTGCRYHIPEDISQISQCVRKHTCMVWLHVQLSEISHTSYFRVVVLGNPACMAWLHIAYISQVISNLEMMLFSSQAKKQGNITS